MSQSSTESESYRVFKRKELEKKVDRLKTTTTLSIVVAIAVACVGGYLWYQLEDLKTTTDSSLQSMQQRISSLSADVGYNTDYSSLSDRIDDLEGDVGYNTDYSNLSDRVASLESNADRGVQSLSSRVADLESDVGSVFGFGSLSSRLVDLAVCVNDYMDVIADAGGGRYTYYYC